MVQPRGLKPATPTCVSLLFLKGMWALLRCSAAMTSPSELRLLLIAWASFSCCPATSDLSTRSEPGRGTHTEDQGRVMMLAVYCAAMAHHTGWSMTTSLSNTICN